MGWQLKPATGTVFAVAASLLLSACASPNSGIKDQLRRMTPADLEEYHRYENAPGPFVPGWNVGGADPGSDLRSLGADTHYFAHRTGQRVSVTILTDRPLEDFVPPGWRLLDAGESSPITTGRPFVNFIYLLSPRYVLAIRGTTTRVGDVDCDADGGKSRLFERPGVRLARGEPDREEIILLFRLAMRTLAAEDPSCVRYDGDRERGYRKQIFLPDGRILPHAGNPNTLLTIVPAGPVETILRPDPPLPPLR